MNKTTADFKYNFEQMLSMRKTFSKLMAANLDFDTMPAFYMFAEALLSRNFTSQQELSDYLECNKAHTSRTLFKMHSKGLVSLSPKCISLTKKGREYAQKIAASNEMLFAKLIENINEQDMNAFLNVVKKILENAKNMQEKVQHE